MKGAGRGSDGLFRFPNGDGDQSEKRYHVGIIVEKTGEDKGDTKKLRTMHVYSRSVNILYGRIPCSEDWRQYNLGDWIQFNVRGGKYFNNYRMESPFQSRISPSNELVVQVYACVFFAPDFVMRRTTSRDGKRYYKMWSPELGGAYVDEYSMNAFNISPKDNLVYKGWVSSSHEMNFAPNDMDLDGWPLDRSLYWQLCYVPGQSGNLERSSKDIYDNEVQRLYIECETQAKEADAKIQEMPIHDRLADEFNKRDHSSQLIPETERVALPRIVVDRNHDLKPCFISSNDTSVLDEAYTGFKAVPRASTQTTNSGIFGSGGGSSIMAGFGFSGYGKQSNTTGVGGGRTEAEPRRTTVFQGMGFNYEQIPTPPEPSGVMCADLRNGKTPALKTFGVNPSHVQNIPAAAGDAAGNKGIPASQFNPTPLSTITQIAPVENRERNYGVAGRGEPRTTGKEEADGNRRGFQASIVPQGAPIGDTDRCYGFVNRVEPRNIGEKATANVFQTSQFHSNQQNAAPQKAPISNNDGSYGFVNRVEPRNIGEKATANVFQTSQFHSNQQNAAPQKAPISNNDGSYACARRVEQKNVAEEAVGSRSFHTSRFHTTAQNAQIGSNERSPGARLPWMPMARGFNTAHAIAGDSLPMSNRLASDNITNALGEMRVASGSESAQPRYGGFPPRNPSATDRGHAFGGSGPRVENGVAIGGFARAPTPGNNQTRPF